MSILQRMIGSFTQTPVNFPENSVLIDVRSPAEYQAGHIDGAICLPVNIISEKIGDIVKDKSATIIVYCQSGARSGAAMNQLKRIGYQSVTNGGGVHQLSLHLKKQIC